MGLSTEMLPLQLLQVLLVSGLVGQASSHTFMQNPVPFASQLLDNAPMSKDGSNWPCNGEVNYDPEGVMNIWERGSSQYLQAMGGASHGGGSCQISVTTDLKPTINSEWRVIHSIHGGCPIRKLEEDNYGPSPTILLPDAYNFTIPEWLPVGRAVMAWTWYGRWSVPEMFMNCAPVMILGGNTRNVPEEEHREAFAKAPLMFEANNGNGCWTRNQGSCVQFPEPGDSLEVNPECPLLPDAMFQGTCGPDIRLANILGTGAGGGRARGRNLEDSAPMILGAVLAVGVLASVARMFWRGVRVPQRYHKLSNV